MSRPTFTILVVEDDLPLRGLVKLLLKREGCEVMEAGSVAEARQALDGAPWDLILLDRRLPDGDGLWICSDVKGDHRFDGRFVILFSADNGPAEKVAGFACGADDYFSKPFDPLELVVRLRAWRRIVELQKQLEQQALVDPLTHLYNRRHFERELARAVDQARRHDRPLAVAMIDVDHFKKINDTWGHAAGDRVLEQIGSLVAECSRTADVVARWGGEEFALILPETTLPQALLFAQRIRELVEASYFRPGEGPATVRMTVSIGIAAISEAGVREPNDLVKLADEALYDAKRSGRNHVRAAVTGTRPRGGQWPGLVEAR